MALSIDEIEELIRSMDRESKAFKEELYKICWFMRGSITIEQAFALEPEDREIISNIIKGNLEITKETKLPFF